MKALRNKRGDTFTVTGVRHTAAGAPVNLTGYTLRSQAREPVTGDLLAELSVVITNAALGQFTLSAAAVVTADWNPGTYELDVEFSIGGVVDSTETTTLEVVKDITR